MSKKKKVRRAVTVGRASQAVRRPKPNASTIDAFVKAGSEVVEQIATKPVFAIKDRVGRPTRSIDVDHVIELAESIQALGLIEPIAVDADAHLLAGAHRLAACRVLEAQPKHRAQILEEIAVDMSPRLKAPRLKRDQPWFERLEQLEAGAGELDVNAVPVRVFALDSMRDQERALAIEAAENEKRRDYTNQEVRALYQRLLDAGFHGGTGRPPKGARPAKPLIALVIGKSERQVRRILSEPKKSSKVTAAEREEKLRLALRRAASRYVSEVSEEHTRVPGDGGILNQAIALLKAIQETDAAVESPKAAND